MPRCEFRFNPVNCPGARFACGSLLPAILSGAILWSSGCGSKLHVAAGPADVEVVQVIQKDAPITKEWVATLTGKVNAQIRAQVAGYLVKQLYINGAVVTKGTPLFQLDSRTFQASLDQATGILEQAQGDLARAQAQQGKTQLDVNRYTPLAQTGAISRQELDNAVQSNLSALAQVEAAKAAVASAEAALETARLNLGYTTILAPVDGVAGIATAQVGDFISPQSPTPLTTVSTVNPILANINPSEQEYLKAMREFEEAGETEDHALGRIPWQLVLADGSIYPHTGKFSALDRQVDISAGAILLQIEFPNPTRILRPGGFGNVRSAGKIQKGALLVPQRAITDIQGKYLVAVVGSDNKVDIRPVTVGERSGSFWIIHTGVKAGEHIVAEGTQKVSQGATVNPKPYSGEAAAMPNTNGGAAH